MTTIKHRLALAALLAMLASASFAQFGGGGGGMGGGGGGGHRGRNPDASTAPRADPPLSPEARSAKLRDQLYDLRLRLMLTPAQSPLWDASYNQVWDVASHGSLARAPADGELNAAQAVQQRASEAGQKAAQLKGIAEAVDKLYASLTDDQRRIADQDLPGVVP